MIETKFKALTFNGHYVDQNLLGKGIYFRTVPHIYIKITRQLIVWLTGLQIYSI